jgi:hypothetical protein
VKWPSLWSSGQSSWLQIQRSGLDSRGYQIFWEVVGLEWGPLSLVSSIEELLERKSSGSGLESREDGRRGPSCWPCGTPYWQTLALTSPTSGGLSVGIVRGPRPQSLVFLVLVKYWPPLQCLCSNLHETCSRVCVSRLHFSWVNLREQIALADLSTSIRPIIATARDEASGQFSS